MKKLDFFQMFMVGLIILFFHIALYSEFRVFLLGFITSEYFTGIVRNHIIQKEFYRTFCIH